MSKKTKKGKKKPKLTAATITYGGEEIHVFVDVSDLQTVLDNAVPYPTETVAFGDFILHAGETLELGTITLTGEFPGILLSDIDAPQPRKR